MTGLDLAHDVLDAQLIDRQKRKIGRVDSLVLVLRDAGPPRVATILVGGPVRARRVGGWMTLVSRALRAVGRVQREGVTRIPFDAVRCIGDTIQVDVDGDALEAKHVEDWLAEHLIRHIPGSGSESEGEDKK
jgi:sporulation protein YlmC with PRC-barrel domain